MPSFLDTLLARPSDSRHYLRVHSGPPPETLADRLAAANVAAKAAKRIDTYERFYQQHTEHRKAQVRVMLGAVGLVLSVGPSVPALVDACQAGAASECGLRVSAITGGLLAMGVTAWSFYDLYRTPIRLSEHVARLNEEMARSMHAKNGETAVQNLFDLYRQMNRAERATFKTLLHERARQPRTAEAAARAQALDLEGRVAGPLGAVAAASAPLAARHGGHAPQAHAAEV